MTLLPRLTPASSEPAALAERAAIDRAEAVARFRAWIMHPEQAELLSRVEKGFEPPPKR